MKEEKIKIKDAEKDIYFIASLAQRKERENQPMHGILSSKADYMGGILDRWINKIPENILFNKIILRQIFTPNDKVEVISDYYAYNPVNYCLI